MKNRYARTIFHRSSLVNHEQAKAMSVRLERNADEKGFLGALDEPDGMGVRTTISVKR